MQHVTAITFFRRAVRPALLALAAAACLSALAAPPAAATPPQPYQMTLEQLTAELDSILADLRALRRSMDQIEADVIKAAKDNGGAFECPPGEPNKATYEARLTGAAAQLGVIRGRRRALQEGIDLNRVAVDFSQKLEEYDVIYRFTDTKHRHVRDDVLARIPPSAADCAPQRDAVTGVNVTAPSVEPGQKTTIRVSARTASGGLLTITSASITGAGEIGTLGAPQGLGTTQVSFDLDVPDPRRQGPFNLQARVTGDPPKPAGKPAPPRETASTGFTYTVRNVAPVITSAPAGAEADPGERLTLAGDVVIRDANADDKNLNEVARASLTTTGHPAGLNTDRDFDRLDISSWKRPTGDGVYTATVKRDPTVDYPHRHGRYVTNLQVTDSKGATADTGVILVVRNVAPTITLDADPDRFVSNDNRSTALTGRVVDPNFNQDVESISVDATDAGGPVYSDKDGSIQRTPDGDDAYTLRFRPAEFKHTPVEGPHAIRGEATDGGHAEVGQAPQTGKGDTDIFVGNEAPRVGGVGYGRDSTGVTAGGEVKRACPGDAVQLVATASDPDGDALAVTATVTSEGGASSTVTLTDGDNNGAYDGVLTAPAPGTYTITYQATESATGKKKPSNTLSVTLIVDDCGGRREEPRTAPDAPAEETASADDAAADAGGGLTVGIAALTGERPMTVVQDGAAAVDFGADPVTDAGVNLSDGDINVAGFTVAGSMPVRVGGREFRPFLAFDFLTGSEEENHETQPNGEISSSIPFLFDENPFGTGIGFGNAPVFTQREVDYDRYVLRGGLPFLFDGDDLPFGNPFRVTDKRLDLGFEHDFTDVRLDQRTTVLPFAGEFGGVTSHERIDAERDRIGVRVDLTDRWVLDADARFAIEAGLGFSAGVEDNEARIHQRVEADPNFELGDPVIDQSLELDDDGGYFDARARLGVIFRPTPDVRLDAGVEYLSEDVNRLQRESDGQGRFFRYDREREDGVTVRLGARIQF